ncbi:LTA synthase family protein [Myroides sp. N17-2]|uniref:LTA synthase family protein n=1 Tax=Myroides sp. N17-2 TaxID=2030799 RepID=UPI000EFBB877|nr:alkaline phosphatase family protein [Myroides sp. N17-2]
MNIGLYKRVLKITCVYFVFFFFIFLISRFFFLFSYGNVEELNEVKVGIVKALISGARFDISAICYGFLPLVLFWLVSMFIPQRFSLRFLKIYYTAISIILMIVLLLFLSLIIIDYFFYQFFQSHINLLFFGIFYDDTSAVLDSVWTDYPILKIVSVYLIAVLSFIFLSRSIKKNLVETNISVTFKKKDYLLTLVVLLFFIGMRGSLGEFTLRREHTNVSTNEFVNSLGYNAIYSLKFANSERKENMIVPDIDKEIASSNYKSIVDIQKEYLGSESPFFDNDLSTKTAYNEFLEKNPPNVIFLQMESMSNHYFELNTDEFNLIGDLKEELPNLYYFKNGTSAFNGTIQTLENFIIGTPKTIISQSVYFDTPFSTSIALPFKSKGYDTYFLTGANLSWRNIDKMLERQHFDYLKGNNDILEFNPNAEQFAWGVHDGYLFDYIFNTLKKEDGKPKFIFGLTISNHTPFEVPTSFKTKPIKMPAEVKKSIRVKEDIAYANFYSHQYAASELARLIKTIKESPYGENTIIVASGDHNIRQVFEYTPEDGFMKRSVPILFYIPEKYKPAFFDANIMAAHKDIFPTIFNLSLSNAKYIYTGDDLFDKKKKYRFAINDYNFMADSIGAIAIENDKVYYYTWAGKNKRKLLVQPEIGEHGQYMLDKMKTFTTMHTIKIYQDIQRHQQNKD